MIKALYLTPMIIQVILASLILAILALQQVHSALFEIDNFAAAYRAAQKLESDEYKRKDVGQARYEEKRHELLFYLMRKPKSDWCEAQIKTVENISGYFRKSAYAWIEDAKKRKGWLTNLVQFGGPMVQIRSYARFLPGLESVGDRYEMQASKGALSQIDVDCDLAETRVKNIHSIMFLLDVDIKYLIIESPNILNRAIFSDLKRDKLTSNRNLYNAVKLSVEQRALLADYFMKHADTAKLDLGQAADSCLDPSEYILGRLFDSCQAVESVKEKLAGLESDYQSTCGRAHTDPHKQLEESSLPSHRYQDSFEFCQRLLNSLTDDNER